LAARRLYRNKNIIVLDFGTALTADVIESSGHVGGFILPGPSILFSSLAARTDRLPDAARARRRAAIGVNTRGAIASGILLQLKGGIAEILRFVREKRKRRYLIVVTGGQARLAGRLGLRARENRTLTLSGIRAMGLK
jgi:type III pantothenate kinase